MNITPPDYPIVDGFLLDTTMKCTPNFRKMALEQWDALRRTGSYRSKDWTVPENSLTPIPARNSYEYQIKCVPGSAIWGFTWVQPSESGPFSFNVRDACTGVSVANEWIRCDSFRFLGGSGNPAPFQQPFSRLIVIAAQGLVTVEICSLQPTDQTQVQIVLHGGEPVCPS
jgi:hypothetical protein